MTSSLAAPAGTIELHGKTYRVPTRQAAAVVVVCIDGFDAAYLEAGCADGTTPTMASWVEHGFHATATCAMPSLTNPNNVSIITGVPPRVHGVSGNYYLDKATGREHMVLDDSTMRGSTILELLANADGGGVRVAAITAKDKLRRIIDHGLSRARGAICFSAQYAGECSVAENGIDNVERWLGRPTPPQYSGDLSLFVLDAGLKLLREKRADVFYLTLSDFIQHKYAPRSVEADEFLRSVDTRLGEFEKLEAIVAVTGDHGMSDKSDADGNPNILFLEDFLNTKWPECGARIICPIADPFVKHHGALGGFVRVHLMKRSTESDVKEMLEHVRRLPQVEMALSGEQAASLFEMPPEYEGEMVVISKKDAVIGSRRDEHDLSQLKGHRLRSHGGLSEQYIPLLRSTPLGPGSKVNDKAWRNFDIFDLVLNY